MRYGTKTCCGLFVTLALLTASGAGAQPLPTDIGEIRPADPAKFYKKPGYSPYAGRHYPTRRLLGRSARPHGVVGGRRHVGRDTHARGRRALRARRAGHVDAPASRRKLSRPLDWVAITDHSDGMGIDRGDPRRQPRDDGRSDGQALARHDGRGRRTRRMKATIELITAQPSGKLPGARLDPEVHEVRLEEDHRHHGEVQRARALHRLHRLRVDLAMPTAATTCTAT